MLKPSKIPLSPFIERRRETEHPKTALFVNYPDYHMWATLNNCVIEGTRGTGKTSILNVLNYEARWLKKTNIEPSEDLKSYFKEIPGFIGIYMRCEAIERSLWNRWNRKLDNDSKINSQILFASFLNYYFIEKILDAMIEIQESVPEYRSEDDDIFGLINDIINVAFPDPNLPPSLYDFSIRSLRSAANTNLHNIRQQVYSLVDFSEISTRFSLHSATSGVLLAVTRIVQKTISKLDSVSFFFLLDDVDRLDPWQIEVVNSFISSSEGPISFKLTCTGDYRIKTNTNNRSISTTDLHVSKLNDDDDPTGKKDEKTIDDLFSGVFRIRLRSVDIINDVPLSKVFDSSINIEEAFERTLSKSISPDVRQLIKDFKSNEYYERLSDFWIDHNKIDSKYNKVKIIQNSEDIDLINHKYYNKYRVSAVFSAIIQFGLEESFSYSSFEVIKMLSSGSLRHFLRICDKLWPILFDSLSSKREKFPIEFRDQSKSIREAAEDVYNNIELDQFNGEIETSCKKMCDRIGSLIKSFMSIDSIRKSPECLSLLVDLSKLNQMDQSKLMEIIDRLRMFEAIKTKSVSDCKFRLALSPMLAPIFCLPYRSPFSYSYTLPTPALLVRLLTCDESNAESLMKMIYLDRVGQEHTPNLFPND